MSTKPYYSIVIPTFNSEATVARALDSVLNQTFQNYEILIMDGLSTDGTKSIIEDYQLRHGAILMYSEKDNGIYEAMNKGIERSKGRWLYFMGSDDFLFDKHVLTNVFNQTKDTTYDVVYGNVHHAALNTIYDGQFDCTKLTQKNICHQSIFAKKTVFDNIGNFDVTYKTVADWHHNIRWFYHKILRHRFINITIAEYASGGYSSQNRDQKFIDLKNQLFFKYGFSKLPLNTLISITTKIVKKHKVQNRYVHFLMYGCILFFLKAKQGFVKS